MELSIINKKEIKALEGLIQGIALEKFINDERLNEILEKICLIVNLEPKKPIQVLFDRKNSSTIKGFISVCLLKLICISPNSIWKRNDLRVKTFSLFDEQFQDNIYRVMRINPGDENYTKLSKLQSVENNFLGDFDRINKTIVSVDTAIKVRKNYMRAIKSPLNKQFLDNFIEESLVADERLGEIFESIIEYSDSDAYKKLDSYNKLRYIINTYISYAKVNDYSCYTQNVIIEPFENIFKIIKEDFENNETIKPTILSVRKLNRKYPFHIIGKKLELKFEIINSGPGFAFEVTTEIIELDEGIQLENSVISSGMLEPDKYEILFSAKVVEVIDGNLNMLGQLSWKNFNAEEQNIDFEFELDAQRTDLDWEKLKLIQPYSLEAVENEYELVGRKDTLDIIHSKLLSPKMESSIIYGQKRVGKTSLAKTIQSRIEDNANFISIFIGTGGLDKTSPDKFIQTLGDKIVRRIAHNPSVRSIEKPVFKSSLEPLIRYFEDIVFTNKELRFVIIIDEFDEIPIQLYPYTSLGDSFFHNIRSISGEEGEGRIGFILVGGENMNLIMQNTDKLNKFDSFRVDYFDKTTHWNDFRELIIRPVKDYFEFNEDSINILYDITEGNPFYTKYLCKRMYKNLCESRNAYISQDEIEDAIRVSINDMQPGNVNHFWSDGIRVEDSAKRDLIETLRRKFLISFAEIGRCRMFVCRNDLKNSNLIKDIAFEEILESYINRNVIIKENDFLRIKPRLFEKWLLEKGHQILRSSFSDEDALDALKNKESEAYIEDSELLELSNKWVSYRGTAISVSQIRLWLNQFEDNIERRLIFNILKGLTFYNEQKIREKLRIIHNSIKTEVVYTLKEKERVRRDVLLSSFGEISKSGPSYTRMYASENNITVHNVVSFEKLSDFISKTETIKAIIFIDDIIASGQTIIENLDRLNNQCGKMLTEKSILIIVSAICGFSIGIDTIEKKIEQMHFEVKYKICDFLTQEDQCFSNESRFFEHEDDRERAKGICFKYGRLLQKKQPLGYNDSQLAVVFHDNCPNNTLPIIWSKSNNDEWNPLFKRN